jgi:glycosyl transferase family 25
MTTGIFPPVFIINLERSTDRCADMTAKLAPLQIDYSFFKAIDGQALDIDTLPDYAKTSRLLSFGHGLMKGEIGCLLSHRAIYRHMVDNNIDKAIILEDDVDIEPVFPQIIRDIIHSPAQWDLVRFLAYDKVQKIGRDVFALPTKPHALARIPTTSGGAYCYMLNLKAARVLLQHMQKNVLPVDILHSYVWRTGLETFIVRPSPVSSDPENNSTIGRQRFEKIVQLSGWQKIVYPFTRAWHKFSELLGKRISYGLSWPRDVLMKKRYIQKSRAQAQFN